MGLFVNLVGPLQCVRCKAISEGSIQTYLLRAESDNHCRDYRVGESEIIDGLIDYFPLEPRVGSSLVVVVGDWDCAECGLNYQWAKATFDVDESSGQVVATLRKLSTFQPYAPERLSGVHYLEYWLVDLTGLTAPPAGWRNGLERWLQLPVAERCELIANGYREWAFEVAGVVLPAQQGHSVARNGRFPSS